MTEQETAVAVADQGEMEMVTTTEPVAMTAPTTPALQRMAAEAAALDTAFKMAQSLSKTNVVPQRFQQSFIPKGASEPQGIAAAYDLAAAIVYGAEIGLSALQAAQNVFPVHGQPSVYAKTMVAQVRRWIDQNGSGHGPEGDDVWEVSATADRVVWAGRRNGKTASAEWTKQRAETAGFTKNELYRKLPIEMLRAKAQTEVCRILFQDVLLGMSNSVEELQLADGVVVQRVTSTRPAPKAKGVAGLLEAASAPAIEQPRHPAEPGPADQSVDPTPVPEPDPIHAADAAPGPAPAVGDDAPAAGGGTVVLMTKAQRGKVLRALATEKLTDPKHPDTLTFVSAIVGTQITDLDQLTEAQADAVINAFAAPTNDEESK